MFGTSNNSSTSFKFGQQNTAAQQPSGGLFGQQNTSQPQQSGGLFGQNNATPQQPSGGLFGQQNTSTQQPSGGLFGQQNTSQPQPSGGLFGQQNTAAQQPSGGLFGQQNTAAQQPSGGLLGAKPAAPSTGLFGQTSTTPQTTTGGLFGAKPAAPSTNLFGQAANPAQPATTGLFNAKPAAPSTGLFGQSSTTPQAATGGLFGAKPAAPSTGLFGTSTTTPQATTGGLFGAKPPAPSTGLFGTSNTNTNPVMQPQQQQVSHLSYIPLIRNLNINPATKIQDLPEEIKKELTLLNKYLETQLMTAYQIKTEYNQHQQLMESIPKDLKFLNNLHFEVKETLLISFNKVSKIRASIDDIFQDCEMVQLLLQQILIDPINCLVNIQDLENLLIKSLKLMQMKIDEFGDLLKHLELSMNSLNVQFSENKGNNGLENNDTTLMVNDANQGLILIMDTVINEFEAFMKLSETIAQLHQQVNQIKSMKSK